MKTVSKPRTIGDLFNTLVEALDADDWGIEPGSLDEHGLTITADGTLYRIRLDLESTLYPPEEAYEGCDYRSGAYLGESDPNGFNGMESPDHD